MASSAINFKLACKMATLLKFVTATAKSCSDFNCYALIISTLILSVILQFYSVIWSKAGLTGSSSTSSHIEPELFWFLQLPLYRVLMMKGLQLQKSMNDLLKFMMF